MKKSARQKSDTDHWSKHEQKASSKICTKKTNPAPDPPTTTKAADKAQHQANGTDYRYTVEFSKNGHAPLFGLSTSSRATPRTLPEDLGQFKPPRSSSPQLTRRSVNFATSRVTGSEGRVVWLGWCGSARPACRMRSPGPAVRFPSGHRQATVHSRSSQIAWSPTIVGQRAVARRRTPRAHGNLDARPSEAGSPSGGQRAFPDSPGTTCR